MRSFCIFLLLIIWAPAAFAQLSVVKIQGVVHNISKKQQVSVFTPIDSGQVLKFSSATDYLILGDSSEHLFYLYAPAEEPFLLTVQQLTAESLDYPMETQVLAEKQDLVEYFSSGKVLLTDGLLIPIDPKRYPQGLDAHFYINYQYALHSIDKRLAHIDNYLLIDRPELFTIDLKLVSWEAAKDYRLFYYRVGKNKSELICKMQPVVVESRQLHRELLYLSRVNGGDHRGNFPIMYQYIQREYGKIGLESLRLWIEDNFYVRATSN